MPLYIDPWLRPLLLPCDMGVKAGIEDPLLSLFEDGENMFGTRPVPTPFCIGGNPFDIRDVSMVLDTGGCVSPGWII